MNLYCLFILASVLFSVKTWCQTVQNDWITPSSPSGSTVLQSGVKFSVLWKSQLQYSFPTYCPSCDIQKLDLWITEFNGTRTYSSKIGSGIDITTTTSYDWYVTIASESFSEDAWWMLRFVPSGAVELKIQQISSAGFQIKGLRKASSTIAIQSSSATSSVESSSRSTSSAQTSPSMPTTFTDASSMTSASQATQASSTATTIPSTSSKNNTWIAGVVVGPVVGIALGAALMWFCLRKRKSKTAQAGQGLVVPYDRREHEDKFPVSQEPNGLHTQAPARVSQPWQGQVVNHDQAIVEAPGDRGQAPPSELWQGNYGAR